MHRVYISIYDDAVVASAFGDARQEKDDKRGSNRTSLANPTDRHNPLSVARMCFLEVAQPCATSGASHKK
jgi:hypothetical protein